MEKPEGMSMFDYQKFEDDLVIAMEDRLRKWAKEYKDIYILSLDCARDMTSVGIFANTERYLTEQTDTDSEDYWYYKYCEEEWDLCDAGGRIGEISSYMNQYTEENDDRFTDPETFEFSEAFDRHCDQMIETCKKAIKRLKQVVSADFPDLLFTFNIREYSDSEERTEFFAMVNGRDASEEYAEHIDDFN